MKLRVPEVVRTPNSCLRPAMFPATIGALWLLWLGIVAPSCLACAGAVLGRIALIGMFAGAILLKLFEIYWKFVPGNISAVDAFCFFVIFPVGMTCIVVNCCQRTTYQCPGVESLLKASAYWDALGEPVSITPDLTKQTSGTLGSGLRAFTEP